MKSPPDFPEKSSHGDIDILVSSPLDPAHPPTPAVLATALSAVKTFSQGPMQFFAVPSPDQLGQYVQVDVQVCSPALFDWEVFHASYGDFWNILGTAVNGLGLITNNRGLHLRVGQIGAIERKKRKLTKSERKESLLFLTCEPDAVLRFLGLDVAEYRAGWITAGGLFAFLARNRFMTKQAYVEGVPKRLAQREMYRRFVFGWMRHWSYQGATTMYQQTREEDVKQWKHIREAQQTAVLQEALDRFGKRAEYDQKMAERGAGIERYVLSKRLC